MKEAGSKRRNSAQCTRNDHCVRRKKKKQHGQPRDKEERVSIRVQTRQAFLFSFPAPERNKGENKKGGAERASERTCDVIRFTNAT